MGVISVLTFSLRDLELAVLSLLVSLSLTKKNSKESNTDSTLALDKRKKGILR